MDPDAWHDEARLSCFECIHYFNDNYLQDLLTQYKNRYAFLEAYAPKLMSKDEILKLINNKFSDIVSTKNKGQIMKNIMPEFKGKADGKLINEIIEELCK